MLDGDFDDYIDEWANSLAATDQPVLLRFAHEANGDWYPWSETRNDNSPGEYVAVWRYVHDRFEQAGADNVIWVWAPNVSRSRAGRWPIYPGDDYVDLVGLVGLLGALRRDADERPHLRRSVRLEHRRDPHAHGEADLHLRNRGVRRGRVQGRVDHGVLLRRRVTMWSVSSGSR
ncbi:MAG: glycosyl hydrolase [Acidimicrobiales bacterium]